jgi:hypothetical protein
MNAAFGGQYTIGINTGSNTGSLVDYTVNTNAGSGAAESNSMPSGGVSDSADIVDQSELHEFLGQCKLQLFKRDSFEPEWLGHDIL